ncbi:MAG: BatD family protein [Persicimonas sp.]
MLGLVGQASDASAQTQVRAHADPDRVEQGDFVNYTVMVSVQGNQRIEVEGRPDFGRAFQVVGTTNAPSHLIRNGNVQKSLRRIYRLRAVEEGNHTIEPPRVRVGGTDEQLDPIKVRVRPPGKGPRKRQRRTSRGQNEKVFLDQELAPTRTPYVGEQLTLTYYLYADAFRLKVNPQPPEEPSLDDFWIEDLSQDSSGQRRTMRVNGRVMERVNMRTYALFPLRAGRTRIDPLAIDVHTGGFGRRTGELRLESDPVELDVQPLPANAPDSFYEGNVGQWKFRATTDRTRAEMGQAITVRLVAEGAGQVGRIELPTLPELDGARIAGQNEKVDHDTKSEVVSGSKTLEYTVVAEREGTLEIPALEFSYFEPNSETYKTLRSDPISIEVSGGEVSLTKQAPIERERADGEDEPDMLERLVDGLSEPKQKVSVEPTREPMWRGGLFWLLVAIPALGVLAVWFERPARKWLARGRPGRRRGAAYKEAMRKLDAAEDAPAGDALDLIREALTTYLIDVAGLPAGAANSSDLSGHLERRGVDAALAERLATVVAGIGDARYSPDVDTKNARADELRRECRACLEELERARKKRRWTPAAAKALLLAAAIGAGLAVVPVNTQAKDAPQQAVADAQQAQRDNQWDEAARLWSEVAHEHPRAPDVLYNLGTSLAHTGDYGQARLMLERAALLAPGDEDIESNRDSVEQMVRLRQIEFAPGTVHDNTTSEGLFWWRLTTSISPKTFAVALIALLWLLFLASLTRRLVDHRGIGDTAIVVAVIAAVGVALTLGSCFARAQILDSIQPAVITEADIPLREGPSRHASLADIKTMLVPGVVLRVEDERDGWVKLAFADGETAWAPRDHVQLIAEGAE